MPHIILSTLHAQAHLNLPTMPWGKYYEHRSFSQERAPGTGPQWGAEGSCGWVGEGVEAATAPSLRCRGHTAPLLGQKTQCGEEPPRLMFYLADD